MAKIKTLPEEVYRKIAAGEVVERPLSVVKELVENSLDAQADSIQVNVSEGGKRSIEVSDTGEGFAEDDIELAFKSHSTSKLAKIEDLNTLTTLGFRGEALPSILEVSEIELSTSDNNEGSGYKYIFTKGTPHQRTQIAFQRGTTIKVRDLFYNFPVRKKFLKSERTELSRITSFLEQLAMVNFQTSFSLTNNSRSVFNYQRTNSLEERIYQIFGKHFLDALMPIDFGHLSYKLNGFISRLNTGASSKKYQYFFVNKRAVREATLFAAFNNSFQKYLEKNRFPVGILLIDVPASEIDVNIHPMKLEIKFERSERIYQFIKNGINSCFDLSERLPSAIGFKVSQNDQQSFGSVEMADSRKYRMTQTSLLSEVFQPEAGFNLIGQYRNSYVIIEKNEELLIVDQHNAHERINFERLKKSYQNSSVSTVSPLFPLIIELSPSEMILFDNDKQILFKKSGFDLLPLSNNSFDVKAFPQVLHEREVKGTIVALLQLDGQEMDFEDRLLAEIACKSAIKVNTKLIPEEMIKIVTDLFATDNPWFCPHKRPIIIKYSLLELEKLFKRK